MVIPSNTGQWIPERTCSGKFDRQYLMCQGMADVCYGSGF